MYKQNENLMSRLSKYASYVVLAGSMSGCFSEPRINPPIVAQTSSEQAERKINYSKLAQNSLDKSVDYLKEKYAQKESESVVFAVGQVVNSLVEICKLPNITTMNDDFVVLTSENSFEEIERRTNESVAEFLKRLSGMQGKGILYGALQTGSPELEAVLSSSEQKASNGLERFFEETRFKYVTEKQTRQVPQNHCPGHKKKNWYGTMKRWNHDGGCETRWVDELYDAQVKKEYNVHVKLTVNQEVRKGIMVMDDGKVFDYIAIVEEHRLTDDGEVEQDRLTRKVEHAVLQEDGSATFTYVKILDLNEVPED